MDYLDFTHGGNIYRIKREYGKGVLDFSANINPLGLPKGVKGAIFTNYDKILHYPDCGAEELRQRIAEYWGINEENILVGNGSVELIYLIMYAFMPKTTVIPIPTFSEYERVARIIKSKIKFIQLNDFRLQDIKDGDCLFLCNPNNPTGNFILNKGQFEKFVSKLIVVDEAFMDFLIDEPNHTLIWNACLSKNLIVLRTFTKFFALAGLRIGYLVAHKDIIQTLRQYKIPWSVNALAQEAAKVVLSDKDYIEKTREFIEKERGFLFDEVKKIEGLTPYPSVVNFLLVRIENKNITSSILTEKCIEGGVLIRDCANFRGFCNKFIRIAVRLHKENLRLLEALREII